VLVDLLLAPLPGAARNVPAAAGTDGP
jgi:hypothetical protein